MQNNGLTICLRQMINGNVNLVSKTLASSFRISASGVVQTFHLLCREIFGIKIEFEYRGNFNISFTWSVSWAIINIFCGHRQPHKTAQFCHECYTGKQFNHN